MKLFLYNTIEYLIYKYNNLQIFARVSLEHPIVFLSPSCLNLPSSVLLLTACINHRAYFLKMKKRVFASKRRIVQLATITL